MSGFVWAPLPAIISVGAHVCDAFPKKKKKDKNGERGSVCMIFARVRIVRIGCRRHMEMPGLRIAYQCVVKPKGRAPTIC